MKRRILGLAALLMAAATATPAFADIPEKATGATPTRITIADTDGLPGIIRHPIGKSPFAGIEPFSPMRTGAHKPAAAPANMPMLRGNIVSAYTWTSPTTQCGIYELTADGSDPKAVYNHTNMGGSNIIASNYAGDTYRTVTVFNIPGLLTDFTSHIWAVDGDDYTFQTSVQSVDISCCGPALAEDKTDGTIYGCFYTPGSNPAGGSVSFQFGKLNALTDKSSTSIAGLADGWTACGFDSKGQLYALTYTGHLVKVDKTNGAITPVGDTQLRPVYASSGTIDPKTDTMYYILMSNTESALYSIDLATARAKQICIYSCYPQVLGMYIPKPLAAEKAPAVVSNLEEHFEKDAMKGYVSFDMPTTLYDGTAAEGTCDWGVKVYLAGAGSLYREYSGTSAFGAKDVRCEFEIPSYYATSFKIQAFAKNEVGESPKIDITTWIGPDRPVAVDHAWMQYSDGAFHIGWRPVTQGEHGDLDGYVDPEKVTYKIIRYPDGVTVAGSVKGTSYDDTFALPELPAGKTENYYYTVTPSYNGQTALTPKATNNWINGSAKLPYKHPYSFDPYSTVQANPLEDVFVINANGDKFVWVKMTAINYSDYTYTTGVTVANQNYMDTNPSDDWLITPAIVLEADKYYEFTYTAFNNIITETLPAQKFRTFLGKTPTAEAMKAEGIALTDVTVLESLEPVTVKAKFICKESGTYHYALQNCSDGNTATFLLTDMSISAPRNLTVPGAPTAISVTPDPDGQGAATVKVTLPVQTLEEKPLATIDKVEFYRDGTLVGTVTQGVAPGAEITFADSNVPQGIHTYEASACNADGKGIEASIKAFVGVATPGNIEHVKATEQGNTATVDLKWTKPTVDKNGFPLAANIPFYNVYDRNSNRLASYLKSESYTHAFGSDHNGWEYFYVEPETAAGYNTPTVSNILYVGKPLAYPFTETSNPTPETGKWGTNSTVLVTEGQIDFTQWMSTHLIGLPGLDDDSYVFATISTIPGGTAEIQTPKILIPNDATSPALQFYFFSQDTRPMRCTDKLNVRLSVDGGDWSTIESYVMGDNPMGWNRKIIDMAPYRGHCVQIGFEAESNFMKTLYPGITMILDHIVLADIHDLDISASGIEVPTEVNANDTITVTVNVFNDGREDIADGSYTVILYRDNTEIGRRSGPSLVPGIGLSYEFEDTVPVTVGDETTYYATVLCEADQNMANNISRVARVKVNQNIYPAPELTASLSATGHASLSWNRPEWHAAAGSTVTDGFEGYNPWDGIDTGLGDWTLYDVDAAPIGGILGFNWCVLDKPQSFFVVDVDASDFRRTTYKPHTGNKMLGSMYVPYAATNDWLVSPEISADGINELTFWARSITEQLPESLRVAVSTDGNALSDFVGENNQPHSVLEVKAVPEEWTQYTVLLPEGTKYFAIQCNSVNGFMLMLDDISYGPLTLDLEGYNVYRDGVRINDAKIKELTHTDTQVGSGRYDYNVTAVWDKGESVPSNTVTIVTTEVTDAVVAGANVAVEGRTIVVTGAESKQLSVAGINGIVLYSGTAEARTAVEVLQGIYIVTVDGTSCAVLVK